MTIASIKRKDALLNSIEVAALFGITPRALNNWLSSCSGSYRPHFPRPSIKRKGVQKHRLLWRKSEIDAFKKAAETNPKLLMTQYRQQHHIVKEKANINTPAPSGDTPPPIRDLTQMLHQIRQRGKR